MGGADKTGVQIEVGLSPDLTESGCTEAMIVIAEFLLLIM